MGASYCGNCIVACVCGENENNSCFSYQQICSVCDRSCDCFYLNTQNTYKNLEELKTIINFKRFTLAGFTITSIYGGYFLSLGKISFLVEDSEAKHYEDEKIITLVNNYQQSIEQYYKSYYIKFEAIRIVIRAELKKYK